MTGLPVMRPIFMVDPKDLSLRREENAFTIGADLLVLPRWTQMPNLQKGTWREIALVPGDRDDPDQARLLVRAGSIVPLGRVVQSTTEDSLSPLTLLVCLDEKGHASGQLYEDQGDGFGYQSGQYRLTTYSAERNNGKVNIKISGQEGNWPQPQREAAIEVIDQEGQREVARVFGL